MKRLILLLALSVALLGCDERNASETSSLVERSEVVPEGARPSEQVETARGLAATRYVVSLMGQISARQLSRARVAKLEAEEKEWRVTLDDAIEGLEKNQNDLLEALPADHAQLVMDRIEAHFLVMKYLEMKSGTGHHIELAGHEPEAAWKLAAIEELDLELLMDYFGGKTDENPVDWCPEVFELLRSTEAKPSEPGTE